MEPALDTESRQRKSDPCPPKVCDRRLRRRRICSWRPLASERACLLCRTAGVCTHDGPGLSELVTGTLAGVPRRRAERLVENALLRQPLIALGRRTQTPRLTRREWLSLVFLARWVPNEKQVLPI